MSLNKTCCSLDDVNDARKPVALLEQGITTPTWSMILKNKVMNKFVNEYQKVERHIHVFLVITA